MTMKSAVRGWLERRGLYLRRVSQLPYGMDWMLDAKRLLPPQEATQVLFDVGAHKGQTARKLRAEFPVATIHSFEPIPSTFEVLARELAPMSGVHAHNLALDDSPGVKRIHAVPEASTNSLAGNRFEHDPAARLVEVACTTLDDFCARSNIASITILKTDTEGLDASVLNGAKRMLGSNSILIVCCETTFNDADPEVSHFSEITALLARFGLVPVTIYPHAAAGFGVLGKFFDTLFVKQSLLPGWTGVTNQR